MTKFTTLCLAAAVMAAGLAAPAEGVMPYLKPQRRANRYNWHANYVYTDYGRPTALIVPPTAQLQTNWSWGAPSLRISRIDHQFSRNYLGAGGYGGFQATPRWPQDTGQFGVYYVRGPWYPTQP